MALWKDSTGREWVISIDTRQLRRVREATGFELGKLLDNDMQRLKEIGKDPELFCRVVLVLVSDQAERLGVDRDQFEELVGGDYLESLFDAFMAAYTDFSPSHRRKLLVAMVKTGQEYAEKVTAAAIAKMESIDLDAVIAAQTASSSVTGSPVLSESIPPG